MPKKGQQGTTMFGRLFRIRRCSQYILFIIILFVMSRILTRFRGRKEQIMEFQNQQMKVLPALKNNTKKLIAVKRITEGAIFKQNTVGLYETLSDISNKIGLGQNGHPVRVKMQNAESLARVAEDGLNIEASDAIDLDRSIPDSRTEECQYWHYPKPEKLPKASVVIIYHSENELLSPLLRTIHSVIKRSPEELLQEIIIVDDASKHSLRGKIESHLDKNFPESAQKVAIFEMKEQVTGLAGCRNMAAKVAKGDVLVFVDAYSECGKNWLPPLLTVVGQNSHHVAVPLLDTVQGATFGVTPYRTSTEMEYEIFDWGMRPVRRFIPPARQKRMDHMTIPYESPVFRGDIFAIDRQYFLDLGSHDPGFKGSGGESMEMAFKVWLCGGQVKLVPCSRVAALHRAGVPMEVVRYRSQNYTHRDYNIKRTAEVWMGAYKTYAYSANPLLLDLPVDDLTSALKAKNSLKCETFAWYLEKIAFDVPDVNPFPSRVEIWGEFTGEVKPGYCLEHIEDKKLKLMPCHHGGGRQLFHVSRDGQIVQDGMCVRSYPTGVFFMASCDEDNGPWSYQEVAARLLNTVHNLCAEKVGAVELALRICDDSRKQQHWYFKKITPWKEHPYNS